MYIVFAYKDSLAVITGSNDKNLNGKLATYEDDCKNDEPCKMNIFTNNGKLKQMQMQQPQIKSIQNVKTFNGKKVHVRSFMPNKGWLAQDRGSKSNQKYVPHSGLQFDSSNSDKIDKKYYQNKPASLDSLSADDIANCIKNEAKFSDNTVIKPWIEQISAYFKEHEVSGQKLQIMGRINWMKTAPALIEPD